MTISTSCTRPTFDQAVIDIVTDLSQALTPEARYQRLLDALCQIFACDAAALLQLRDTVLQPTAVSGLSEDTLGRRFVVTEHPRFSRILLSREPVRFVGTDLPDPYDGLIEDAPLQLPVHDCMGAALYIDNTPWGILTFDALEPGTFDRIDPVALRTFIRLTEASVKTAQTIDSLRQQVDREQQFNRVLLSERDTHELVGKSAAMQALRRDIGTVAGSDLPVLILGETGVGKELVAQQLHQQSSRAQRSMVHVNCAALPESLAESELFGHRRGAFTGAASDRAGKFELADGGTLFLDEIGELPPAVQAKLLRVLQSGEVQRVGQDQTTRVDVRIVAATNRDLKSEIIEGRFRVDLYHRLSVFPIVVPPLRERGHDVLALAGYFLEGNQQRLHIRNIRLSAEAKNALLHYEWPGNVRELEHLMSRAALLAAAEQGSTQRWIIIETAHLGLRAIESHQSKESDRSKPVATPFIHSKNLADATHDFQVSWLQRSLEEHGGNMAAAARAAGMDRSNFFRLLKKLGLR